MPECPACHAEQSQESTTCSECGFALTTPQPTTEVRLTNGEQDVRRGQMASPGNISSHGRFLPGTVIADRCRIVSLVGKGGMGEVYRVDDMKLGHAVALKFLPCGLFAAASKGRAR